MVQAIRHHSVSRPRSSNAACGFPALRSPTGFTAKHTTRPVIARDWAADAVFALRQSSFRRFLALQVFCRLSPITMPSPSSEAHQKSGPFPPPALPGLNSTMALSDTRRHRCLFATLRPRPSCRTDLHRLPAPPFPTCRAQYPGGPNGCMCRLLPHPRGLPRYSGGSASATSLSRPAQTSLTLRPAGLLNRPRRPSSRGFGLAGYPATPLVSYQINRQLSGWNLPPLVIRAFGAHCHQQTSPIPVPVVNQIRTYWWCNPPKIGRQRMCPAR